MLQHIARNDPALAVPRVVTSTEGKLITRQRVDAGQERSIRLFTYLAGEPMSARPRQPAAFHAIGSSEDVQRDHADAEQLKCLHDAIEQLPSLPRTVLGLHYRDGLAITEIAQIMDCPEGTVKSHLNRGRARLKAAFAPLETTHVAL